MRHLFVTNDFPPKTGGIESYLVGICAALDPSDVLVIAPSRKGQETIDEALAYPVIRLPSRYLRATRRVRRAVVDTARRREVDVIHVMQTLPLGRIIRRVRKMTRKPVTLFAHGAEVLVPARLPFVRRSLRRVLTSADLVFTVSDFTRRELDWIARRELEAVTLYPSLDLDRFSLATSGARVRERYGLGSRFTIVFVSRLVKRKGAETLIRALPGVPKAMALIVGSGPEAATLRRVAEDIEVADRVVFTGPVSDAELPEHYAAGDVFCMPVTDRYGGAEAEGLGIVYLEAAACGLPVVAGRSGGSAEAVSDGTTGVVLDDPSPARLAQALKRLASDGALRTQMGAAGRERMEREFAPEALARRLEEAVGALLKV